MKAMPEKGSEETSNLKDTSVVKEEIDRFSALAEQWWDPKGPMAPLHAMNPVRTEWVKKNFISKKNIASELPTLLDIGCGAGLASESFARLGFETLGVDASEEAIKAAQAHLKSSPLPSSAAPLSYMAGQAEHLVEDKRNFDVVCALEIIEHVRDPQEFLKLLAQLTKPGGQVVISTLSRTVRSFLVAKLGAEYLLRLLPIGTHDWKKFIKPAELDQMSRQVGLQLTHINGLSYRPPHWRVSHDLSINYIALFKRN
ncbi:bifunctional 2-polyprenyl-6-hydroxyphenol methylase/3-demethylubiquinol 3-O-methyltransferase UbiG [Aristophania vespae]|nr:bifunctional 2-polyprenyl-6-hydroxyphenol methylase/3-demethylubiquinol 3-O-methyltransferase UbiG [Aristophania vespae]